MSSRTGEVISRIIPNVLWNFLKCIRNKFRDDIFWIYCDFVFQIEVKSINNITATIPVSYRFGDGTDLALFSDDHHEYDISAKLWALERFGCGDKLMLAILENQPIHYAWIMFNQMDLDYKEYYRIPDHCVYAYKAFTSKPFRGNGVYPGVFQFIKSFLEQWGIKKVILRIRIPNSSSIRAVDKVGFSRLGKIYKVNIFTKNFYFMSAEVKKSLH